MSDREPRDFVGVVVAAGRSARFGGRLPKQFADLSGRPMLEWSVRALTERESVRDVVVVLPPDELDGPRAAAIGEWPGVREIVGGGVDPIPVGAPGLEAASGARFVLVHDAARPLADAGLVQRVIDATRQHGAALPVLTVADTVKKIGASGAVETTLDRECLRLAQTPQGARADWLVKALQSAHAEGADPTDEAAALEWAGKPVAVVAGNERNRKITSAEDLEQARRWMLEAEPEEEAREPALRIGNGFDIHRVDPDRPLVLGGVRFEGHAGLHGHSDADVVLHAAMDAVLGAAGLGDIGFFFPPDDPRFRGAASTDLAVEVSRRVQDHGYRIVNLDLTFLAESPRIRDRAGAMRRAVAECFGIDADRVGLKATTLERLGALGRGEGMACQAVALVRRIRVRS